MGAGFLVAGPFPGPTDTGPDGAQPSIRTYAAASTPFTPDGGGPTDFWTIRLPTTGAVGVARVQVMGFQGVSTGAGSVQLLAVKRSTVNLGGTSAIVAAIAYDSNDGAANAIVRRYTANPGTLGTAIGNVRSLRPTTGAVAAPAVSVPVEGRFDRVELAKPIVLRPGESLAWNGNAVAVAGLSASCFVEWTEETF